jgi:N-acetylneuraminate 9-O-acetyltransferase
VQEPDESKLSPERAAFINNADIDAMNSDLIHRLSPESPNFNDREVLDSYQPPSRLSRPPAIRIMFPSVFNKLLHPSLTEDGLHYNEIVTTYQAQILLNLRCNDMLPKKYPLDTTCCWKYPRISFVQGLVLIMLVLYGPLALVLRRRLPDHAWTQRFFPRNEFAAPLSIFGLAIGLCFVADRTGKALH